MRERFAFVCFVALLAVGGTAQAQESEAEAEPARQPAHALSLHLAGLISGGVAVQYERFPETRAWSWAVSLGSRLPAGGDYASFHLGAGGELRWWAFNDDAGASDDRLDGGFFLAGRLDVGWYHVWDTVQDRAVGDTLAVTPAILVGWRFDIARTVEITPSLGLGLRTEMDPSGRLASYTRGTAVFALTAGWMLE